MEATKSNSTTGPGWDPMATSLSDHCGRQDSKRCVRSTIALLYAVVIFNDKKRFELSLGPLLEGVWPLLRPGQEPLYPEGDADNRSIRLHAVQGRSRRIVHPRAALHQIYVNDTCQRRSSMPRTPTLGQSYPTDLFPEDPKATCPLCPGIPGCYTFTGLLGRRGRTRG